MQPHPSLMEGFEGCNLAKYWYGKFCILFAPKQQSFNRQADRQVGRQALGPGHLTVGSDTCKYKRMHVTAAIVLRSVLKQ